MDVLERQQSANVHHDSESARIPIGEVIDIVVQHRRMLAVITGIGMLIGTILAFLIPNEYTSTAQLMPPDPQTFSGTSAIAALSGAGVAMPSLASSLISSRTPGATAIAVLKSREIQDNIINQFDLRRVYDCKFYIDARKVLTKRADFTEDKASGVISIAITDRDRYRARDISQAYVNQLNELASNLSTSSARRERIFLGKEIESVKEELDASTLQLAQFSSSNATFDVQRQGEATVDAATRLQAALITAKSELSAMKAEYADENVRVRELRARIAELQAQLQKMSGNGHAAGGAGLGDDQLLPSLRALPLLGAKYYDLYRQVLIQGAIFETLTKQYELAKVQEAKEIPSIKVLDPPNVPEKKSSPQRLMIVILGTLLSTFGGITWFTVGRFWGMTSEAVTSATIRDK